MTNEPKEHQLPLDSAASETTPPPPLDVGAERTAFAELIAFINAHKDPETEVVLIDPDHFIDGLE